MAYTREQWEKRINDAGAGRYGFVRWAVDGEFGSNHKCVVECVKDGYEWSATTHSLVNNGRGCPQCAGHRIWNAEERVEQINSLPNIEFVSWVGNHKNCYSKANIKCKVDDFVWSSTVNDLVNNVRGCPQCSGNRRWTAEERIEQINSLHGIEFVSWLDCYKVANSKANVRCSKDGHEWIAAVNDLVNRGKGCPKCAKYGFQLDKTGYLYALRSECGQHVKVGISNVPKRRHKDLERETPFKFNLVEQISGDGDKIREMEKYFHENYESAGFTDFDGATEWLVCTPELLEELRGVSNEYE